ncbi:DUF2017 domain-containing protein [Kribbella sp. NBC_01245]|uniref:DUF2017 domain-containing protein n=1 Tax=Kribbella sp. NBC_01245 TaxID=2903578 RepID=UPI002E2CE6B4|nr:DUF2017 domain-containing protein [Kribbella sp. NBC_01245]
MTRFRKRKGTVVVSFADHEAEILANLLRNLVELLYDGMPPRATGVPDDPLAALLDNDGPTAPPEDEVLQRLLPDAYKSDDMASAEFRRFTERGLRDGKITDAKRVLTAIEESESPKDGITVPAEEQVSWLRALNDLRLAIGARLGIEEDDYEFWEKLPDDDPRRLTYDLYDWLGYLQSALLHNMR